MDRLPGARPHSRSIARSSTTSPVALSTDALSATQSSAAPGSTMLSGKLGDRTIDEATKARSPSLGSGATASTNGNHPIALSAASAAGGQSSAWSAATWAAASTRGAQRTRGAGMPSAWLLVARLQAHSATGRASPGKTALAVLRLLDLLRSHPFPHLLLGRNCFVEGH